KNLPEDIEIGSGPASVISLELRGPSGALRNFGEPGGLRPGVVIDMTNVQPGERTFPIGDDVMKLPRGVKLVRAIPAEAHFVFERRMERYGGVVPRFEGEGMNGYAIAGFTVAPKQLKILGPASRVARVPFVPTDRVDISSVVGSAEY